MTKETDKIIEHNINRGCSFCGNSYLDILIKNDKNGIVDYKSCCPNCGYERHHSLFYGFRTNEDAFNLVKHIMKGDRNDKKTLL